MRANRMPDCMRTPASTWAASSILLVALAMASCGGGGGGGDSGGGTPPPPPPPQEPPVFTTPTAVRVTRPTPFSASCLPLPAGATAYVNAEVEPHLALDPDRPQPPRRRVAAGPHVGRRRARPGNGGLGRRRTTWSTPQASPFTQCAGGVFARASDPWVAVSSSTVLQIGIAFTGTALAAGARSAGAGESLHRWRRLLGTRNLPGR